MKPRLLLLGGASTLARAIVYRASERFECRLVVRRPIPSAVPLDVQVVPDYDELPPACFEGVDSVVNCVGRTAPDPEGASLHDVNVEIPVQVARQALRAGATHFIQSSSLSIYGGAHFIDHATHPSPSSDYGRSKLAAERELERLSDDGLRLANLRFPMLYGDGGAGKLTTLARWMLRLRMFPAPRELPSRSILHYQNAAAAVLSIAAHGSSGNFFVSDLPLFDLRDLVEALRSERDAEVRLLQFPDLLFTLLRQLAPGVHASLYEPSVVAPDTVRSLPDPLPMSLCDGLRAFAREL